MSRGTLHTSIRIPPDLKQAAKDKATSEGRDLTAVIVEKLREYVTPPPPEPR